jgi:hypothetical protein
MVTYKICKNNKKTINNKNESKMKARNLSSSHLPFSYNFCTVTKKKHDRSAKKTIILVPETTDI